MKKNKVWIIAGEASGDLYGARLAEEMRSEAQKCGRELDISGMGGPRMKRAGIELLVDSSELGVMGVFEVLKMIFTFVKVFRFLVAKACAERPDEVVLIDYPGFNLRLAKVLHKHGIPVVWYISPQVWVWNKKRIPLLAKYCRKMLLIFPFERDVYNGTGLDTEFVGHPLLEVVRQRTDLAVRRDPDLVLLLPGSRMMELTRLLPPMLETAREVTRKHPRLRFVLAAPREKIRRAAEAIRDRFRAEHPDAPPVEIVQGQTGELMQKAATGMAASGTVTVESAMAGLPLVVMYKMNFFTLLLASVLVKLYRGFFAMPNIIANRRIFEEYLQWHACARELAPALERILPGGARRSEVEQGMAEVVSLLDPEDGLSPSARAARGCLALLPGKAAKNS